MGLAPSPARGAVTPIPAEPPIGGVLWSVVVPAVLFLIAFAATFFLYRHFAKEESHGS